MRPNEANAREPSKRFRNSLDANGCRPMIPSSAWHQVTRKASEKWRDAFRNRYQTFEVFYGDCNCGSVKIICIQARLTIDISKEFKHFFKCVLHFQSVCAILTTVIEIEINILD